MSALQSLTVIPRLIPAAVLYSNGSQSALSLIKATKSSLTLMYWIGYCHTSDTWKVWKRQQRTLLELM